MRFTKNYDDINRRCDILESLGFTILHEDSRVSYIYDNGEGRFYVEIDFSSISEDKFLLYAYKVIFETGMKIGRNKVRTSLSNLLEVEEIGNDY